MFDDAKLRLLPLTDGDEDSEIDVHFKNIYTHELPKLTNHIPATCVTGG